MSNFHSVDILEEKIKITSEYLHGSKFSSLYLHKKALDHITLKKPLSKINMQNTKRSEAVSKNIE